MGGSFREAYDYGNMFDGNIDTFWYTQPNEISITVTFSQPTLLYAVKITVPERVYRNVAWQNICVYLDDVRDSCTASDRQTNAHEVITMDLLSVKKTRKVLVDLPDGEKVYFGELQIVYSTL